ncbi:hypothetical protein [Kerstersia gyiorum]|jgi:integrase|uniref:hypothetical protein n=1 Tax=Kerstersia gyiorum TaxID=206506 RepID=UPI00242F2632|nr:hypothetical protein [Kerstersia gyiorum]MCH4271205.1 hypothetical protein [Kerstersia gyiorum]MCI1227721.1 hypothetical protein [Kerstersia gyiorum]
MASIQKLSNGRYRAQIKLRCDKGQAPIRDSATFHTKREAVIWAAQREHALRRQPSCASGERYTLRDALRRYADEVASKKRGWCWECIRLKAFESYRLPLDLPIARVRAQHIALFRDARASVVSAASVLRELTLLSSVFQTAWLEWAWIETNPCRAIRKPAAAPHRDRVLQWWEIRAMLRILGRHSRQPITTAAQAVAECMMLALRTGMRAGELCGLT